MLRLLSRSVERWNTVLLQTVLIVSVHNRKTILKGCSVDDLVSTLSKVQLVWWLGNSVSE